VVNGVTKTGLLVHNAVCGARVTLRIIPAAVQVKPEAGHDAKKLRGGIMAYYSSSL